MTIAAVILAGGEGTRSADPRVAKIAQIIGERTLMQWHSDLLAPSSIQEVLVVAGHLAEQVEAVCVQASLPELNVHVIKEERSSGTVPALKFAAASTEADDFLVLLGDILAAFPVDDFISRWRNSGKGVGVLVHPSTHPGDSDAVFSDSNGVVTVVPKMHDRGQAPNLSCTGVFAISREALVRFGDGHDIGSDLLRSAAQSQELYAQVSSHYFRDTGTPDRLRQACHDHESGAITFRGASAPRTALFLDRDGVINPSLPEIYSPEHYTLLPGVGSAIAMANRNGIPVIVVTNQPGLAKGFMTFATHEAIRARMDQLLADAGAFVDDYIFCPHHPEDGFAGEVPSLKMACECRKPRTGMAQRASKDHTLNLGSSMMVGDSAADEAFARNSGMRFLRVCERCAQGRHTECDEAPSRIINQAVRELTC